MSQLSAQPRSQGEDLPARQHLGVERVLGRGLRSALETTPRLALDTFTHDPVQQMCLPH